MHQTADREAAKRLFGVDIEEPAASSADAAGEPPVNDDFTWPRGLGTGEAAISQVLVIGACFMDSWADVYRSINPTCVVDNLLFFYASPLPIQPPSPIEDYDFQVISIPLRAILSEGAYMSHLPYVDLEGHERLFAETCDRLKMHLELALQYNRERGLLTFVNSFLVPMANPMGRLMPRFDLRNISYFIEKLNEFLANQISSFNNVYYLDTAGVAAICGKRYIQDDSISVFTHNALLFDFATELDAQRIEPPKRSIAELYALRTTEFVTMMWGEIVAAFRTIRGVDPIKMVIVDLDDSLWRGVLGDRQTFDGLTQLEGWPLGVVEALGYLKKRGIILAIVSKNEEQFIVAQWDDIFAGRLMLRDFAFVRINWKAKVENIAEILSIANILPSNALFLDDNPVERASVKSAYPTIRTLGESPYTTRRTLLWAPETQVPTITDESSRRTDMMQTMEQRANERSAMTREDFLKQLELKVKVRTVASVNDPNFDRSLELINKTNQFNTTGERWTYERFSAKIETDMAVFVFFVEDKFSRYGLVGVVLCEDAHLSQFVMSCRVLGMSVETAVIEVVLDHLHKTKGANAWTASLIETPKNFPCRDLFAKSGFTHEAGQWVRRGAIALGHDHVAIEIDTG